MIGLMCLVGLLTVAGFVIRAIIRAEAAEQIRREALAADREVQAEFRVAKRSMNDAAGQSWRNLAG